MHVYSWTNWTTLSKYGSWVFTRRNLTDIFRATQVTILQNETKQAIELLLKLSKWWRVFTVLTTRAQLWREMYVRGRCMFYKRAPSTCPCCDVFLRARPCKCYFCCLFACIRLQAFVSARMSYSNVHPSNNRGYDWDELQYTSIGRIAQLVRASC